MPWAMPVLINTIDYLYIKKKNCFFVCHNMVHACYVSIAQLYDILFVGLNAGDVLLE